MPFKHVDYCSGQDFDSLADVESAAARSLFEVLAHGLPEEDELGIIRSRFLPCRTREPGFVPKHREKEKPLDFNA
jgi:hypothetical protein